MAGEMNELIQTPLGRAIIDGKVQTVRQLIQCGEDVLFEDRKRNTYLHMVCTIYRPYVFQVLVASGINLNSQNRDGNTALHVTALQQECCHVPDLMACGIDPFIKNKNGKTARDLAEQNTCWKDLYSKYEPGLREAIRQYDVERVKYLLHCWCPCHIAVDGKDIRQFAAGLTYHDIVAIVDSVRFSNMAVYAVMERDYKSLRYALSRGPDICDVNYLQLLEGAHPHHMLQHAIRINNVKMVDMLLKAGANVNTRVFVKEYFRGPLYFEVIKFEGNLDKRIREKVLETGADLTARDERGRSALIYAIDRRNGEGATLELVEYLLRRGINIALRDDTGSTARDVASFARRHDIVKLIDKYLTKLVKASNLTILRQLAVDGYQDMFVEYQYKDTWIYASGNETDQILRFLESLHNYQAMSKSFHSAIRRGDSDTCHSILTDYPDKDMILRNRDKAGRSALLNAILYGQTAIVKWLLEVEPSLEITEKDNCERTAMHYASASSNSSDDVIASLINCGTDQHHYSDCRGTCPCDMPTKCSNFQEKEKLKQYGMDKELICLQKHEELLKVIKSKTKSLAHFDKILKQLKIPVAEFPQILQIKHRYDKFSSKFHPNDCPLVSDYCDLLLASIDYGKEDIARRLVRCGVTLTWTKKYLTEDGIKVNLTSEGRARQLGLHDLATYIHERAEQTSISRPITRLNKYS